MLCPGLPMGTQQNGRKWSEWTFGELCVVRGEIEGRYRATLVKCDTEALVLFVKIETMQTSIPAIVAYGHVKSSRRWYKYGTLRDERQFLRSCIAQFPSIISSFLQGFPSWYVGKEKWKSRLYLQVKCLTSWSTGTLKILWKVNTPVQLKPLTARREWVPVLGSQFTLEQSTWWRLLLTRSDKRCLSIKSTKYFFSTFINRWRVPG